MLIVGVFLLKSSVLFDSNPFHSTLILFFSLLFIPFPFSQQHSAAGQDFSTKKPIFFSIGAHGASQR